MNLYIFLYVVITFAIIGGVIGFYAWLKKKIAPWNDGAGGFLLIDRFVINYSWQILVVKYGNRYYMLAISDKDLKILDSWNEDSTDVLQSFEEVLGK